MSTNGPVNIASAVWIPVRQLDGTLLSAIAFTWAARPVLLTPGLISQLDKLSVYLTAEEAQRLPGEQVHRPVRHATAG